ncbi:midnolin-like isoform X2 [Littorina saxatilis]|uniref:midnolin-like isoform X2 n=1 Tax=Littorina saxatilis TaxID=31220 RepID=UPI0038B64E24
MPAETNKRILKEGTLQDNEVREGSRIVLCPNMESGTSSSHAEHSVMQALRNLSDAQIHDFLTGKSPLTLAIRLGEHLMFVQLQLSTAPSRSLSVQPTPTPPSPPPSPTVVPGRSASTASNGSVFVPTISPVSLLEASRNLTQKLKELTQLTQQTLQAGVPRPQPVPTMPPTPPPSPPPSPGAVIDSMQQVGRGIFSGTFSGTLDPRLQDRSGAPRRDVNTILHILHDLLVAQPGGHIAPGTLRPPPSSSPGRSGAGGGENQAMRDKVQQVQRMLEMRRQRRSARRQNQRPYPSPANHCLHSLASTSSPSSSAFLASDPHAAANPATAENVETSNYRKPNMEQETVAV